MAVWGMFVSVRLGFKTCQQKERYSAGPTDNPRHVWYKGHLSTLCAVKPVLTMGPQKCYKALTARTMGTTVLTVWTCVEA